MKHHVWKVFEFAGWFVLLIGIIFALLYSSISMGQEVYGSGLLIIVGIIFVLCGEYLLEKGVESKLKMVWQAVSIGGAFSLTVGIIWLVIQFLERYESWTSIVILLAIGVALIIIGESIKFEK